MPKQDQESDQKAVFIPEEGEVTEWPTFGMLALRLMTVFPDPETGQDVHPSDYDLAMARALLTGDWSIMRQFSDLTPEEERGAAAETILWYDINAGDYTKKIEAVLSLDQIEPFLDKVPKGGLILDAGCGGGRDSAYFSSLGYATIGIDLSSGMISSASEANPQLDLLQASFLNLPFQDASFDALWAHASIHHTGTIVDIEKSLREFGRVLKKNGVIHLATQAKTRDKDASIILDTLSGHNRFYRYLTLSQVEELLATVGFRILSLAQHKETDDEIGAGRKSVEWIVALAVKD